VPLRLIRIDDRLVHGQVTVGWVPALAIEHILLASDRVRAEAWERDLYRNAAPPEAEVTVLSLDETRARIEREELPEEPTLLLVESPADLLALVRRGVGLEEANVGGMHASEGKRRLLEYVYVDSADEKNLRALLESGVRLYAQDVPGGRRVDLRPLLFPSSLR
jgi:mannose/fructose/N-acetylgalactosamine-specific phosphotransferase system component IIB